MADTNEARQYALAAATTEEILVELKRRSTGGMLFVWAAPARRGKGREILRLVFTGRLTHAIGLAEFGRMHMLRLLMEQPPPADEST